MEEELQLKQRIAALERENLRLRNLLAQHGIADTPPIHSEVLTEKHAIGHSTDIRIEKLSRGRSGAMPKAARSDAAKRYSCKNLSILVLPFCGDR